MTGDRYFDASTRRADGALHICNAEGESQDSRQLLFVYLSFARQLRPEPAGVSMGERVMMKQGLDSASDRSIGTGSLSHDDNNSSIMRARYDDGGMEHRQCRCFR